MATCITVTDNNVDRDTLSDICTQVDGIDLPAIVNNGRINVSCEICTGLSNVILNWHSGGTSTTWRGNREVWTREYRVSCGITQTDLKSTCITTAMACIKNRNKCKLKQGIRRGYRKGF